MSDNQSEQIILGIVHPHGSGGVNTPPHNMWLFQMRLHTWRDSSNQLQENELHIKQEVTHQELNRNMNRINAYSIVKLKVSFDTANEATLLEILDDNVQSDRELNDIVRQLQLPVTFQHDTFGEFTLNRSVDWYEGKISWVNGQVYVHVSSDESVRKHEFAFIKQIWINQQQWEQTLKDAIASEMLDLYNDIWRESNDPELTAEEFTQQLTLESMAVEDDGEYNFSYGDGNDYLFGGHWIVIYGNIVTGISSIHLAG
ncbi:MAG: DUF2262 domain-containing protein [Chloroflexota bacterium]